MNDFLSRQWGQEAALSTLILVLCLLVILLAYANGLKLPSFAPIKQFLVVFFLFLLLAGFSTLLNPANEELAWGYRYYLPSLVIYLAGILGFYYWQRHESLLKAVNLLRFAFLLNTLTVVLSYLFEIDFLVVKGERASGINLNANGAGYIGALALSFELFMLSRKDSRWSYLFLPLILLGIFATFSKSAYLMALGIIILYSFSIVRSGTKSRNLFRLLGLSALILALAFVVQDSLVSLTHNQQARIAQVGMLLHGDINTESTTNRSELAGVGWQKIMDAPLLGQGFKEMSKMGTNIGGVHNLYLLLWGEGGILALLAFIYLLLVYLKYTRYLPFAYRFLVQAILFSIAFYSLTNHNMYSSKSLMLILAFLAIVFNHFKYVRHFWPVGSRTSFKS